VRGQEVRSERRHETLASAPLRREAEQAVDESPHAAGEGDQRIDLFLGQPPTEAGHQQMSLQFGS
jgi:hypothetical protein